MSETDSIPEPRRIATDLPHWGWFLLSTAVFVIAAIGLQFGMPIYRQHVALREIKRVRGVVGSRPAGPQWLHDLIGEAAEAK